METVTTNLQKKAFQSFSPGRVWTLATNTVTQLLRMKILWFLVAFSVLVVAAGFAFPAMSPEQQLKLLKDVSFGALQVFSVVIAISATALLLPRDLEDRTLYTILSKPVPRYEYLIGKLLGVLLLIGGGLLFMDVIFSGVVWLKQSIIISDNIAAYEREQSATPEIIAAVRTQIEHYGLNNSLHAGVWAVFLKAAVISALALLVSCFASSTLFTIVITFAMTIIGHGEQLMRDWFFHKHLSSFWEKAASSFIAVLCPDLGAFDLVEPAIRGDLIGFGALMSVTGLAALYITGYTTAAYLFFVEKEL
jgi:ABC-type transport system involved in multi-copper enzyme maturation permease subunit